MIGLAKTIRTDIDTHALFGGCFYFVRNNTHNFWQEKDWVVNSTIVENMDDTRRFIEQMDETTTYKTLVMDFSKILNSLFSCISQLRKFYEILKTFLSTAPVDN